MEYPLRIALFALLQILKKMQSQTHTHTRSVSSMRVITRVVACFTKDLCVGKAILWLHRRSDNSIIQSVNIWSESGLASQSEWLNRFSRAHQHPEVKETRLCEQVQKQILRAASGNEIWNRLTFICASNTQKPTIVVKFVVITILCLCILKTFQVLNIDILCWCGCYHVCNVINESCWMIWEDFAIPVISR